MAPDFHAAWKTFEEFNTGGGDKMPAATWLELIRNLESQQNFERAVAECERLAAAYPAQKSRCLLSAGRICLRKLNRPADALRNYRPRRFHIWVGKRIIVRHKHAQVAER
jgi:hypothetical protein